MSATYTRNHPGKLCLFIDAETTGADFSPGLVGTFEKYQAITFGLVVADTETFKEVDCLYVEMQFDGTKYQWTDGAEKIHGLSREYLQENALPRDEALAVIVEFISKYFPTAIGFGAYPAGVVCIGGHNVDFDIKAISQLFNDFGFALGIHHVKLETSGASFIAIGEYKSNTVFKLLGEGDDRGSHNALEDARLSLTVAKNIKAFVTAGISSIS